MPDDNSTRFTLINPVSTGFFITDPFNSPRPYANGRHEGIDLRAVAGGKPAEIMAAGRGVIEEINKGGTDYGNFVRIRHDWNDGTVWLTWYAHLATINPALELGEVVDAGRLLGTAGNTGNSTSVHLHLTLQHLGQGLGGYIIPDVVDPARFFSDEAVPPLDEMSYLADVTMSNGSIIEAGRPFTKTWLVRNSGSSNWTRFILERSGGNPMDGPESMPLPSLKPDETGELSLSLVAPTAPGRHRGVWKPRNSRGHLFAFELYVDIVVSPVARRDDAVFIADVTLPPGDNVETNRTYLKTWRVRNTGDTTWDSRYSLRPVEDRLGGSPSQSIQTVRPGATADLSVALNTPAKPGAYRSIWQIYNPEGRALGQPLTVELVVAPPSKRTIDGATLIADVTSLNGCRLSPGSTFLKTWCIRNTGKSSWGDGNKLVAIGSNPLNGPAIITLPVTEPGQETKVSVDLIAPATPGRYRSSWQPQSADGQPFGDILPAEIEVVRLGVLDNATFVSDITYPDGEVMPAGQSMDKTWRIRNSGTSAWEAGYDFVFVADNHMNGPGSVPLPPTLPGELAEVTVPLQAPLAPGIHRSTWRARNPEGKLFGDLLYAEIRIPISSTPGSSAQEDAQLEGHVTFPDGSEVRPGVSFDKTWAIRNTGSIPWSVGYEFVFVGGTEMGSTRQVTVGEVASQDVVNLTANLIAPEGTGRHISRWRMRNPRGELFGSTLFASIIVVENPTKFDMLPYLRGDGRLYEMKHIFEMPNGPLIGQQRVQTQYDDARFYQTKNSEWEEMWSDDRFIYRGTDTSPGSGNFYTLMDGERYGSAWIPRHIAIGQSYRRSVVVVSRRKGNCVMNSHLSGRHITWVKLEAMHQQFSLPDVEGRPGRGYVARDVVVLAAYNEVNGRPANQPFERYYYAKGFGLVMWEGISTDHLGISFLVQVHNPGDRPDNVREQIPCLDRLRP